MNIRILKALGDSRPQGPCRHFIIASILKRIKRPTAITGSVFWNFLSLYYGAKIGIQVPTADTEQHPFDLDSTLKPNRVLQPQARVVQGLARGVGEMGEDTQGDVGGVGEVSENTQGEANESSE